MNIATVTSKPRMLLSCALVFSMALFSGCTSTYKKVGDSFASGYDEAAKTVSANLDAQRKARRLLSIRLYIDKGAAGENIGDDAGESFVRYACAGEGDFHYQRTGLTVLKSYKKIIGQITASPDESLSAIWKSIRENRESRAPLKRPAELPAALDQCTRDTRRLLDMGGMNLSPLKPETVAGVTASLEALKTLVGALEKLAIAGLRLADEHVRARALREFVLANRSLIDEVLNTDLSDKALELAYTRRLRASLVVPYEQFKAIYRLNRDTQGDAIVQVAQRVHDSLGEFDSLRVEAAPQDVAKAMREAQSRLVDLAEGKIEAKDAWAALQALVDMLKDLNDAIDGVKKAS